MDVDMRFEKSIAAAFAMSEEVWARHANPWSIWTRYATFPMLILSIWSRVWFGWWALIPIFLTLVWLWLNPRGFEKPSSTDNWASKAVLGRRNPRSTFDDCTHRRSEVLIHALRAAPQPSVVAHAWRQLQQMAEGHRHTERNEQ